MSAESTARKEWYDQWVKESKAMLAKEITSTGGTCFSYFHSEALVEGLQKLSLELSPELKELPSPSGNIFRWCGWGLHGKMENVNGVWYWIVPRIGCNVEYRNGRELTAFLLLWWFNHPIGDTPYFSLKDVADAAGPLWDTAIEKAVWKHLQ